MVPSAVQNRKKLIVAFMLMLVGMLVFEPSDAEAARRGRGRGGVGRGGRNNVRRAARNGVRRRPQGRRIAQRRGRGRGVARVNNADRFNLDVQPAGIINPAVDPSIAAQLALLQANPLFGINSNGAFFRRSQGGGVFSLGNQIVDGLGSRLNVDERAQADIINTLGASAIAVLPQQ